MHNVLSAPFRHMAIGATRPARMLACGHGPIEIGGMALAARRVVVPRRLHAARSFVRVVATGALQRICALDEALRAPQAVDGVYNLELFVPPRPRCVVEE